MAKNKRLNRKQQEMAKKKTQGQYEYERITRQNTQNIKNDVMICSGTKSFIKYTHKENKSGHIFFGVYNSGTPSIFYLLHIINNHFGFLFIV